jgi:hypothetical protein
MRLSGRHVIAHPREEVFRKLQDPAILMRCIPGCEGLSRAADGVYDARLRLRYGILGGTFSARVVLRDIDPPRGYSMEVDGGGKLGTIRGTTRISLTAAGEAATEVAYDTEASLGGILGAIGERIIPGDPAEFSTQLFADLERAMGESP